MLAPTRATRPELFTPIRRCWVCADADLAPVNEERLGLDNMVPDPDLGPVLRDYHDLTFTLNRCPGCGFMQPAVLPARPDFFDALYNLKWPPEWMAEEFHSGYKDVIFRTILRDLGRRVPGPGRSLLDVGTHVGRMLHLAREAGWRAEGIELNPRTAAFAAAQTGLPVHRKNAKDLAATGARYDVVVLTDVLEHIPDPVPILADVRGMLNPGGVIAVKVPCGPNQLFKQRLRFRLSKRHDPGIATNFVHVNHFGPRSLAAALRRVGFDGVRVGVAAPELAPGGGAGGFASRLFRSAVYHTARFLPFGAHSPLAMNLQAYARNPGSPSSEGA